MSLKKLFASLSGVWQSALVLGGAWALGAGVAFALAGWIHLPEKVEAQGDAIVALQEDIIVLKRDVPRIRCILEAMALEESPVRRCGL